MTAAGIPALLEPIQERLDAATPGPWFAHQDYIDMGVPDASQTITTSNRKYDGRFIANAGLHSDVKDANATLIANATTDTARLLAAVKAVEALHKQDTYGPAFCTCSERWPCLTVSAVEAALGEL